MIKQEWVDDEISAVCRERKNKRYFSETWECLRLALMIALVFFCIPALQAEYITDDIRAYDGEVIILEENSIRASDGIWFMCKTCRLCQWQSSSQADFWGDYYCVGCRSRYQ